MKNGFLLLTLFAFVSGFGSSPAFAGSNNGSSVDKKFATDEASHNHNPIGYGTARKEVLANIALQKKNNSYVLTDVYCQAEYSVPGPGRLPNNSVLNVEHTWPQSKFGGSSKGLQKSDLHHLYPSDSQLNSIRGNNAFGIVTVEDSLPKCGGHSRTGRNAQGTRVFEPPPSHRGNVARALFYFSSRYQLKIDPVQEEVLKQWNIDDPVDAAEMSRNDEIEKIQGNRNPFIDDASLGNAIGDF